MDIEISGRHCKITEAIQQKIEDKLGNLTKYDKHITSADVIVSLDGNLHKIEITVHVPKNTTLHADATDSVLYDAIDLLEEKIRTQIIKHKEKLHSKRG